MAGSSMTFTYDEVNGRVHRIIADWVSDSSTGAVTGTTKVVNGRLVKGITDPGATAPSDNYDITITDEEGVNVLTACTLSLENRHTSTTQEVYFLISDGGGTALPLAAHPVVCGTLSIAVASAGNSKVGQLILYIES